MQAGSNRKTWTHVSNGHSERSETTEAEHAHNKHSSFRSVENSEELSAVKKRTCDLGGDLRRGTDPRSSDPYAFMEAMNADNEMGESIF